MALHTKRIAAAYLGIVFLAGTALGMSAHRFYAVRVANAEGARTRMTAEQYRQRLLSKLERDLGLASEQVEQVELILDNIGQHFRSVREAMEPEFEAIRKERVEQVMGVLDPAQQDLYGEMLEERRRRREEKSKARCY